MQKRIVIGAMVIFGVLWVQFGFIPQAQTPAQPQRTVIPKITRGLPPPEVLKEVRHWREQMQATQWDIWTEGQQDSPSITPIIELENSPLLPTPVVLDKVGSDTAKSGQSELDRALGKIPPAPVPDVSSTLASIKQVWKGDISLCLSSVPSKVTFDSFFRDAHVWVYHTVNWYTRAPTDRWHASAKVRATRSIPNQSKAPVPGVCVH